MTRSIICTFFMVLLACSNSAQELIEYPNGLIYHDTTIRKMQKIVESMQTNYSKVKHVPNYKSLKQGLCNYIIMDTGDLNQALEDIMNKIGFEQFLKKYPHARCQQAVTVVESHKLGERYGYVTRYQLADLEMGDEFDITDASYYYNDNDEGRWGYDTGREYPDYKLHLKAIYFTSNCRQQVIPAKYSSLVHFVDYIIDTSTTLFRYVTGKQYAKHWLYDDEMPTLYTPFFDRFYAYIDSACHCRRVDSKSKFCDSFIAVLLKQDTFRHLFSNAVQEAIRVGIESEDFEYLVEKYDSKKHALQLKRERIVYGTCMEDDAPRIHEFEIARLATEIGLWRVFIRAHISLMNENFNRHNDLSAIWTERLTYIKELEEMHLQTNKLLTGMAFSISDGAANHYTCSIWKIGRALADCKNTEYAEEVLFAAISDTTLDLYNRIVFMRLAMEYIHNTNDSLRKQELLIRLKKGASNLPPLTAARVSKKDEELQKR
ncbi:MAG: hypothetical protein H7257_00375 [Taibaiella sp.]|nr:hypothetical protein [Taibaiella sp.]